MSYSVLITESIAEQRLAQLPAGVEAAFDPQLWKDPEKLLRLIPDFDAIVVRNQTRVTAEVLDAGRKLKVVGRVGAGLDNIDVEAASKRGVVVSYAPVQNTASVAEFTLGLMFALARRIPAAHEHARRGGWDRAAHTGIELSGKVLGVAGLGRIGCEVASRARCLGMKILAYDPAPEAAERAKTVEAELVELNELLSRADVVTCHVPETESTRNLFDAEKFALMKPGALFLNTSRGGVVDEDALLFALSAGKIAGAALDVRRTEPTPPGPLAELDNVVLTPHIAAFTHEAQERVEADVFRDVLAVLEGGEAAYAVNFSRAKV